MPEGMVTELYHIATIISNFGVNRCLPSVFREIQGG